MTPEQARETALQIAERLSDQKGWDPGETFMWAAIYADFILTGNTRGAPLDSFKWE